MKQTQEFTLTTKSYFQKNRSVSFCFFLLFLLPVVSLSGGTIRGMKFNDSNGDGIKQSGDIGLRNWTIFLDNNSNEKLDVGEIAVATLSDGTYEFTNLSSGTYNVREVLQREWTRTTPLPNPIVITGNVIVMNVNFGNFRLGRISGIVFRDINSNGQRDGNEIPYSGKSVMLDDGNSIVTTVTDGAGYYEFKNLVKGTRKVTILHQGGCTTPPTCQYIKSIDTSYTLHTNFNFGLHPEVGVAEEGILPTGFALHQNYPNPFNPVTIIRYSLPRTSSLRLSVFNQLGQEVAVCIDGIVEAGNHTYEYDAKGLPGGMYYYRLVAGPFLATKMFSLVR